MIHERTRDRHTLSLSTGQLVRAMHHAIAQFDRRKCGLCFLVTLAGTHAGVDQGKLDIFQSRQSGQQLKALEDENSRLKRLLADAMLDNAALKDALSKNW